MQRFLPVANARQAPPGRSVGVSVEGRSIAVFNLGGEVIALDNRCPHQGAPLAGAAMRGSRVRCPIHGWVFDLHGSEEEDGLARYPARLLEDGTIEVCPEKVPVEQDV